MAAVADPNARIGPMHYSQLFQQYPQCMPPPTGVYHCVETLCSHILSTWSELSLRWTTPVVEVVGKGWTLAYLGLPGVDRARTR
jgi:hypothetical protein